MLAAATAMAGAAVGFGSVTASAGAVRQRPAATSSEMDPPPIDLDGAYTFTDPHGNPCWVGSLVVSEWIGSWNNGGNSGWEGVFETASDGVSYGLGDEFYNSPYYTGTSVGFGNAVSFRVTSTATTVTWAGVGDLATCTGVDTSPEDRDSLPTISGDLTRSNGTPVGPGVTLEGAPEGANFDEYSVPGDSDYEFWLQPANTYTVLPIPWPDHPPDTLAQCSGHKVPLPNGCTFVIYPSEPPDHGTASWVAPEGIGGTVTDTDGSAIAGIEVTVTGTDSITGKAVDMTAVSGSDGSYVFELEDGSYSVTAGPDPAGGKFLVTDCSGTEADKKCDIKLKAGAFDTADFRRATLFVNSTGLGTDQSEADDGVCDITPTASKQTCTLPQAILASNDLGGQPIGFDIPDSGGTVPQIQDPTGAGMPSVSEPAIIDGTSQPGSGKVELSGTSAVNDGATPTVGLTLSAPTTVKGMVINGYSNDIDINAGPSTIEGDSFGTDASGTATDPDPLGTNKDPKQLAAQIGIDLTTSGNQVGGAGSGQGNVFVTDWGLSGTGAQTRASAAIYDSAGGNTIEGNSVGVLAHTTKALTDPQPSSNLVPTPAILVVGSDIVGGASAGDGNLIAPEASTGSSIVRGNTFLGTLVTRGTAEIGDPATEAGTGAGNTFEPPIGPASEFISDRELEIGGSGAVVQGNLFKPTGDPAVVVEGDKATIGGKAKTDGNVIQSAATDPPGPKGFGNVDGAIVLEGNGNTVENNVLTKNGGWGAVQIFDGTGNEVTRNAMSDNTLGIEFGTLGYLYDTDITKSSGGPNDLEYYPLLLSTSSSSGTQVEGRIEQSGTVTVDIYSQKGCALQSETPGQGAHYLGSTTVSSTLGGENFDVKVASLPSGDSAITATATAADGSTSEFSPCLISDSHAPSLAYGVTPASSTVPVTATTAATTRRPEMGTATSGSGTLTLLCPPNTVGSCIGKVEVKTTGPHQKTIASSSFTMSAGCAALIPITVLGSAFASLRKAHRLSVAVTTTAHDKAKPAQRKSVTTRVNLTYK